jgi:hypothetical protein
MANGPLPSCLIEDQRPTLPARWVHPPAAAISFYADIPA